MAQQPAVVPVKEENILIIRVEFAVNPEECKPFLCSFCKNICVDAVEDVQGIIYCLVSFFSPPAITLPSPALQPPKQNAEMSPNERPQRNLSNKWLRPSLRIANCSKVSKTLRGPKKSRVCARDPLFLSCRTF